MGFQIRVRCNSGDTDQEKENDKRLQAGCLYLIVALHSVDKSLVSHDLCVSVEEGLETILGLLKLLLGDLRDEKMYIFEKLIVIETAVTHVYISAAATC